MTDFSYRSGGAAGDNDPFVDQVSSEDNGTTGDDGARRSGTRLSRLLPPPTSPMEVARVLVARKYTRGDTLTLRHWRGAWWQWIGPRWVEVEQRAVRSTAYVFTEHAECIMNETITEWAPNRHKIADLLDALAAITHLPQSESMPTWLDGTVYNGLIVATANGLLDVGQRKLLEHDPKFFNATSVPFDYDPHGASPATWLRFLNALWTDDEGRPDHDSIRALQEWFGYVVSGRLDLHKILLVVGPTRAGKGVIARTLGKLVGKENVAGPTLSSLNGDFGLAPLIGMSLAVVSDARLSGRGAQVVVERLLSISGEDTLTVNIKYREQWTGKLPCRLMVCSNELPQLGDASAAIAGRFVSLLLYRSWLGKEDRELEPLISLELPGILNWALDGLERLNSQSGFTRPASSDDTLRALQDLASPVAAFVRDRCQLDPEHMIAVDDLYAAWKDWAELNGHVRSSKQVFGRDLRAAVPRIKIVQLGSGDNRPRSYAGISLKTGT